MEVKLILHDKKSFLDLLLLADEHEDMIDRYLERGDLFALYDDDLKSICVVTKEAANTYELKNLATAPQYQNLGYGQTLINHICQIYQGQNNIMLVGTGEVPSMLRFYEKCGFHLSHRIPNFFTDHYDHPMVEDGIQLVDMIYLQKKL